MAGCETRPSASPRTESRVGANGHPFATIEFSRAASAEEDRTESADTSTWPSQKEATRRRSHLVKDGYQYTSVPPNASNEIDGQRPTTHEPQRCGTISNKRNRLRTPHQTHPKGLATADG